MPKPYSDNAAVFGGSGSAWQSYLMRLPSERYDPDSVLEVKAISADGRLELVNVTGRPDAEALRGLLTDGFRLFVEKLQKYPSAFNIAAKEVFSNPSNTKAPVQVRLSRHLLTDATREVFLDDHLNVKTVNIVLKAELIDDVMRATQGRSRETNSDQLGVLWALLRPLLHELGHRNLPRDRFFEEIHRVWCDSVIMRNLLFKQKRIDDRLAANKIGTDYIRFLVERSRSKGGQLTVDDIFRQPFFEMLNQLYRQVDEETLARYEKMKVLSFTELVDAAKVVIREYLDEQYLRPALAQVMAAIPEAYRPMEIGWKKEKPVIPPPEIGRFGIEDEEDLAAWSKVADKFREIGFIIVCQLGIGQFGRVYEAINVTNPRWPSRVAVKVDRIYKKRRQEAIQGSDVMMHLSRHMSASPHVIRIYDAGLLSKKHTYHILQLVEEGETLDVLLGIGGEEPTSRPATISESGLLHELKQMYLKPIDHKPKRKVNRFLRPLHLKEIIDLMVSMLLWVEKVHNLGYAINDVKTGNIMINRRGQLKGIDLDFYQKKPPAAEAVMQDHFLLSWSCLFLFINAPLKTPFPTHALKTEYGIPLQEGEEALKKKLLENWVFDELPDEHRHLFLDCLVDILFRARSNEYGRDPKLFARDIDRLIYVKRLLFEREIVLSFPW
jgi:hypothetical protein